jgi:putative transposase
MLIRMGFSRPIPKNARRSESRQAKGEWGIWLRRYWEHLICNEQDFVRYADYIHYNPVKHGHVSRVTTWPHPTLHRFVMRAVYPCDWGRYALRLIAGERGET